jgi:hypothetical protein
VKSLLPAVRTVILIQSWNISLPYQNYQMNKLPPCPLSPKLFPGKTLPSVFFHFLFYKNNNRKMHWYSTVQYSKSDHLPLENFFISCLFVIIRLFTCLSSNTIGSYIPFLWLGGGGRLLVTYNLQNSDPW